MMRRFGLCGFCCLQMNWLEKSHNIFISWSFQISIAVLGKEYINGSAWGLLTLRGQCEQQTGLCRHEIFAYF